MSVEKFTTGSEMSPNEAILQVTPPCMEKGESDHEEAAPHEQPPSFPRQRDGIDMSDLHLSATITYFCRMVYPNNGDKLHTQSSNLDEFLHIFSEIYADEVDILPFKLANLEMLEIRLKKGLEAIHDKRGELTKELKRTRHNQDFFDHAVGCFDQYPGEIERDMSYEDSYCHCNADIAAILAGEVPWCHHCAVEMENEVPADVNTYCCRYAAYNEDLDYDDGNYCQCASDSEDDLYCQCASSSEVLSEEQGSPNKA